MPDEPIDLDQLLDANAKKRSDLLPGKGCAVWFTGLSGTGKSTLAAALEGRLLDKGCLAYTLDADEIRDGLCSDLGFSPKDHEETIRRVAETAKLFADCELICLTAFISPDRAVRTMARSIIGKDRFIEVYLVADEAVCQARASTGPGIVPADLYEAPEHADLTIDTSKVTIEEAVDQLERLLKGWRILTAE